MDGGFERAGWRSEAAGPSQRSAPRPHPVRAQFIHEQLFWKAGLAV